MHFETNYIKRTNPFFFTLAISKRELLPLQKRVHRLFFCI